MNRIDLFVKILVFVKILSQWRRKEEEEGQEFRSLKVRRKLIALKNMAVPSEVISPCYTNVHSLALVTRSV